MALSQIQCLNEHHVNLRTNESKPEFLYSEEQRLALERLLDEGPDCFHEFIKTNRIRPFLSDLELAQLSASVEHFCPDLPDSSAGSDGDSKETRLSSLQYWPERSDDSLPQLELGWPQRASYRGLTRVAVHAQPPLHGDAHIKEVIRRTIAQAQKVIAVVMDLFTDVDIFKDLLHASFKRNVAVYIVLEVTGVPHFLKMCESAAMHTGHLKNLRVRSIRGTGFFTHSSKKVCGSQSQKFMFVDGDKAVSGSYSFTWAASRLDRSIITVLTGQAVDLFDQLFQDLYMMSNAINLNTIKLEKEKKLEPITKAAPPLQPSTAMALKLFNPKYALVSGNAVANINRVNSEMCTAKNNSNKLMKEVPEGPRIHPGLLHLEKANMIDYLPVWPEPDPPGDVTGFINMRDCNKPLQAHLTRSDLFEVSQVIRFKDPICVPQESLSEKVCPRPTTPTAASANEQPLMQPQTRPVEDKKHCHPPSSLKEQAVCLSPIPNPKTAHSSKKDEKDSLVDHGMEKQTDVLSKKREELDIENIIASTSAESHKDSQVSENPSIHPFSLPLILHRVAGNLEPIPGDSGRKEGDTLDGVPTHRRAHSYTHTHSHTTDHLDMPISLRSMSLNRWRKPEYPEETHEARGEFANSAHTGQRWESNPQPQRCEANVLTTKPPCPRSENPQIHNITPASAAQPETSSDKQSCENIAETISNKDIQANQRNTHKLIETDNVDCPMQNGESTYSDSSSYFLSEAYFGCSESASGDSEIVGMVNRMPTVSKYPDEPNNALFSLMSGSCEDASSHDVMKETEESRLPSASPEECHGQHLTVVTTDKSEFTSLNGGNSLSESVSIANKEQIQETDSTSQPGTKNKLLHQVETDAQVAPIEKKECLQKCELCSVVNMFDIQPVEGNDRVGSQLLVNESSLQDKLTAPYVTVRKTAEAQCIVFSDPVKVVPLLRLKPETCSGFNYTSNLKSALEGNDGTHSTPQSKPASLNNRFPKSPNTERSHDEACSLPFQVKPLIAEESNLEQGIEVKDMDSSNSELKETATAQIVDKAQQLKPKTSAGVKFGQLGVDIHPLKRKTLEHIYVQQENNQPEGKPKSERNVRKLHRVSPQPKPIPTHKVKQGSTKASVTKVHSSAVTSVTSPVSTLGVQNDPRGRQLGQNGAANDLPATPAKLHRRHTAPIRSKQTQLRPLQTELSADHHCSSQKQPQAQQDRIRVNQLHQSSFRQRSAPTPKTTRTLKERITGSSSQTNQKKTL
ncbi:protein FAM83G [Ictalurus punctatus]|uniref:Protein FAM83G n=1 Tax=Ictalurus punctatus TaxID=7998 RepID=A0A9F7R9Y6_ICTPU|nr:protein FAM83G [Ictalurus punctatus]